MEQVHTGQVHKEQICTAQTHMEQYGISHIRKSCRQRGYCAGNLCVVLDEPKKDKRTGTFFQLALQDAYQGGLAHMQEEPEGTAGGGGIWGGGTPGILGSG